MEPPPGSNRARPEPDTARDTRHANSLGEAASQRSTSFTLPFPSQTRPEKSPNHRQTGQDCQYHVAAAPEPLDTREITPDPPFRVAPMPAQSDGNADGEGVRVDPALEEVLAADDKDGRLAFQKHNPTSRVESAHAALSMRPSRALLPREAVEVAAGAIRRLPI